MPPNRRGRDFVVGDLHGYLGALQDALARAGFDPGCDRLFSTGDLIDRGPDSPGCAALLGEPWFYAVRGNHEDMLLRVLPARYCCSTSGARTAATGRWTAGSRTRRAAAGRAVRTDAVGDHGGASQRQALRHLPRAMPGGGLGRDRIDRAR
ncbi:MAG: metallophosphoesterase [Gammaproteobacteria bacterium]|nr:metallophosphoesterase [Gammaproteobacteria bacterium]